MIEALIAILIAIAGVMIIVPALKIIRYESREWYALLVFTTFVALILGIAGALTTSNHRHHDEVVAICVVYTICGVFGVAVLLLTYMRVHRKENPVADQEVNT